MRVAVVIPVFNEERSLPLVIAALPADAIERVVVADNGSSDGSAAAAVAAGGARRRVEVVREPRRGYGSACLAALSHLRRTGPPDVVVFLDGDFSDHPEELPEVVAPITRGEADFVVGSRTLGQREAGALLPQARAGNALATRLIRLATGFRYTDLGPFRAISWAGLESLGMRDRDFGWTCEMQMKALEAGLRIVEVPVSYRRRVGVSKIAGTLAGTFRAGVKILWWIARLSLPSRRARARRARPEARSRGRA